MSFPCNVGIVSAALHHSEQPRAIYPDTIVARVDSASFWLIVFIGCWVVVLCVSGRGMLVLAQQASSVIVVFSSAQHLIHLDDGALPSHHPPVEPGIACHIPAQVPPVGNRLRRLAGELHDQSLRDAMQPEV